MAPLHTALFSLSVAFTAVAQQAGQVQLTWAAVSFIYHGEKTPALSDSPVGLTPLGANQLYNQGQLMRSRYLVAPENGSQLTTSFPINGLSTNNIQNSQLYIKGIDDAVITASGTAFLQGLYPPRDGLPVLDEENRLSNGSYEQYPLNGYQYPNMATISSLDFNYIWIGGNIDCSAYSISQAKLRTSSVYIQQEQSTLPTYQSYADTVFSTMTPETVNYMNAYNLYEYALYEYNHNTSLYNSSDFSIKDLSILHNLASSQQWSFNTPHGSSTINAIAGRTFASKVLQQFQHNVISSGVADKLTLLFGGYETFLAFFALANLSTGPSGSRFTSNLPEHGSLMTFELFSYATPSANKNFTQSFPEEKDLWVRFLFRNGTSDTAALTSYPLFGRPLSETDMPYTDFVQGMATFSVNDVAVWCTECGSVTMFCESILNNIESAKNSTPYVSGKGKPMNPQIAGVIGATVTIAALLLVAAALALFGFRLEKHGGETKQESGGIAVLKRSGSGNGGFKGAEKLASDTDLRLKNGAGATVVRHERVGSWELNESPIKSSLDKDIENGRIVSTANYNARHSEDGFGGVNPFGDPVRARENV